MIVVTGAAGFIGSNVIAELEACGKGPIVAVDWFGTDERWRNLAKRTIDEFVRPENLDTWLAVHVRDVRAIVHMGARTATTETDVDMLVSNNINYTVRLWNWCTQNSVPFIYASSAATYGGIEDGFDDNESIEAMSVLQPLNAYGWSKKATDLIFARSIANNKPTPPQWAGLKFFNVYGPNEYHKNDMMSVICKMYYQIRSGEAVKLFKSHRDGIQDGEQRRDFVYVRDCSRAIVWLLENPQVSGLFNLGSGHARSFLDIVRTLERAVNLPIDIEFIDMPVAIRDRYQYYTQAEVAKVQRAGYDQAFSSIEDGIKDYVSNYLTKKDRYR